MLKARLKIKKNPSLFGVIFSIPHPPPKSSQNIVIAISCDSEMCHAKTFFVIIFIAPQMPMFFYLQKTEVVGYFDTKTLHFTKQYQISLNLQKTTNPVDLLWAKNIVNVQKNLHIKGAFFQILLTEINNCYKIFVCVCSYSGTKLSDLYRLNCMIENLII